MSVNVISLISIPSKESVSETVKSNSTFVEPAAAIAFDSTIFSGDSFPQGTILSFTSPAFGPFTVSSNSRAIFISVSFLYLPSGFLIVRPVGNGKVSLRITFTVSRVGETFPALSYCLV